MSSARDTLPSPALNEPSGTGDRWPQHCYRLYQTVIGSQMPFATRFPADPGPPEIVFRLDNAAHERPLADGSWDHHFRQRNDDPWLSCARLDSGFLLRKYGTGDFFVSPDGANVHCIPVPDFDPWLVEQTFLYNVLPRMLNLRGFECIRAAAVKIGAGAVAFVGHSNAGKSTLAAHFLRLGFPILTDEILVLDHIQGVTFARPGNPELYLRADVEQHFTKSASGEEEPASVAATHSLGPGQFWPDSLPLLRIYILDRQDADGVEQAPTIDGRPDRELFFRLMNLSYVMNPRDSRTLKRQAELFQSIITAGVVRRLHMVRGFDLLPRTADLILKDCRVGGSV